MFLISLALGNIIQNLHLSKHSPNDITFPVFEKKSGLHPPQKFGSHTASGRIGHLCTWHGLGLQFCLGAFKGQITRNRMRQK